MPGPCRDSSARPPLGSRKHVLFTPQTGHDGVTLAKMRACAQTLANPARFMQWRRRALLTTWKHACGSGSEICK